MKTLESQGLRFERIEPGLFRYKSSRAYYTVLKKDGKTKWKNLQTTDKETVRRLPADTRQKEDELDAKLSGLEIGPLTETYLASISNRFSKTLVTRQPASSDFSRSSPPQPRFVISNPRSFPPGSSRFRSARERKMSTLLSLRTSSGWPSLITPFSSYRQSSSNASRSTRPSV